LPFKEAPSGLQDSGLVSSTERCKYVQYVYSSETDEQLMLDYETLDEAKDDVELPIQIASGYFAVLSGKMFDFREKEDGDEKVSSVFV
jgi:hypothetical protein